MAKKAANKTPAKKAATTPQAPADNIELLESVQLMLTAELGRTRVTMEDIHELGDQSLVELEKTVGDPIDIMLNGELFARSEVVTVSENFGVRITEIVEPA
jgi:flagellar motor switch protein FliN/FliY